MFAAQQLARADSAAPLAHALEGDNMPTPWTANIDWAGLWTALAAIGQCVEALIVGVSAIAVLWQVRRWREESVSHKVQGVGWLLGFIGTERFAHNAEVVVIDCQRNFGPGVLG